MINHNGEIISKLLRDVNSLVQDNFKEYFCEIGLTPPQIMVAGLLCNKKSMKISEISEKINLSNSTVSGIVDRLEKLDAVRRVRDEKDRRVVRVELTDEFEKINVDFHGKIKNYFESLLSNCNEEDCKKIVDGLETLRGVLQRENSEG
jgi:MarR family transcriptional regulator, organic hydroperoxide resistance regulator